MNRGFFILINCIFKHLRQIPIHIYAIALSLLASLFILSSKDIPRFLKLFPFFLFLTLVVELTGTLLMTTDNTPLYNFFSIFEFVFYLYIIKNIIQNHVVRKIITIVMLLYPITALVNIFFILGSIDKLHITTYSLGCLIIVIFSIYYFYELFKSTASVDLKREPAFWIITGLLFFYTCSFPIFGFSNFISAVIAKNIGAVLLIINVILYILFAVAFLCRIRIQRSMLS